MAKTNVKLWVVNDTNGVKLLTPNKDCDGYGNVWRVGTRQYFQFIGNTATLITSFLVFWSKAIEVVLVHEESAWPPDFNDGDPRYGYMRPLSIEQIPPLFITVRAHREAAANPVAQDDDSDAAPTRKTPWSFIVFLISVSTLVAAMFYVGLT